MPELLGRPGERVFIAEGEKAADAVAELGYLATTSPHGSKSAGKVDWTPLAGRDVVILPDADEAGGQYADDVVAILAKLTPAATVKVVELADLPKGGDAVEYIEAQHAATMTRSRPSWNT